MFDALSKEVYADGTKIEVKNESNVLPFSISTPPLLLD